MVKEMLQGNAMRQPNSFNAVATERNIDNGRS